MEKYTHVKELTVPLYRMKLFIVLSNNTKRVTSLLGNYGILPPLYAYSARRTKEDKVDIFLVFNFHKEDTIITAGTIAHEALHAANILAEEIGIITTLEHDEPLAYLVEWIVDQVHQFAHEKEFLITLPIPIPST